MSQCDCVLISSVLFREGWNESEDLGRDPAYWGAFIAPGPDQAEYLENVLLKSADLRMERVSVRPCAHFVRW